MTGYEIPVVQLRGVKLPPEKIDDNKFMNLREIINGYRDKIYSSNDLGRTQATQYMVELSALMGNVSEEVIRSEQAYMVKFNSIIEDQDVSVARAEILAKITEEYKDYKTAKDYNVIITEIIRALKYRCKALSNEEETSYNQ